MVFSSNLFLFVFLPAALAGYYLLNDRFKNFWLLLFSLIFYSWGEPKFIFLILASIAVNYIIGILIERLKRNRGIRIFLLISACITDLGLLMIYKYSAFFIENINSVFGLSLNIPDIALPIGISFYTFQILSYIIDVYRGDVKAQKSIIGLSLYISLFSQLIAGPIVRYIDVEKQIAKRHTSIDKFYNGVLRFSIGFTKKILIADTTAAAADTIFNASEISCAYAWLGIIAYTVQIYFDFSGYSDMAIGLGKMFGFDFIENFDYPYISKSIQEFWRRWHISLGSWFRDYVYIPLGGSRKGNIRTYINTIIVFFLTGFWHGASWNFIVWGLYYAVFLTMERAFLKKALEKLPVIFQHIYAVLVIMTGWVFFRAETLGKAVEYIRAMLSFTITESTVILPDIKNDSLFFIIIGIVFSLPLFKIFSQKFKDTVLYDTSIMFCFILSIMYMVGSGFSPFLYFRF